MADSLTKEKRSWNMSRIKGNNTRPEVLVRSILHKNGFRFRINVKNLPGKPDIVLPKYKTVIFVHGCFWHHHKNCKYAYTPKSRIDFWNDKFHENQRRDKILVKQLKTLGWRVCVVWECNINNNIEKTVSVISRFILESVNKFV